MLALLSAAMMLCAAASAAVLAWRRADHGPFALFLVGVTAANMIRIIIGPWLAPRPDPFTGVLRGVFHVEQALFLTWSAGLAAVVIALFLRRRWLAALPGLAWAAAVLYLSTHYPEVRGEELRRIYLGAELAALAVAAASIVTWRWRKEYPTTPQVCALLLCLVDAGTLFLGAWKWGFWRRWDLNQASYCFLYFTLTLHQVYIWKSLSR